jgi:putative Mg2+ transporter-C (MgtC) family protein
MEKFWEELFPSIGDTTHLLRVVVRLIVALVMGGVVGFERQFEHKTTGMRTHMLVALGAATFTLVAVEVKGNISQVIQGVAAGIGFLGAGTIFKLTEQHEIKGLNSAASIWVTAAIGMAVGIGFFWPAIVTVTLAWFVLYVLHRFERYLKHLAEPQPVDSPVRPT